MDDQPAAIFSSKPSDPPKNNILSGSRTNISLQLTSFIGRAAEITEIQRLLKSTRLLTLVGPGGVGKTRLAIEVGRRLLSEFKGGVWLVDLAAVLDPLLIEQAVAQALQVYKEANRPLLATIIEALQDRHLLLVLDNCEHLLEGCTGLVNALLGVCPTLTLLATSREPLGIGGELVWQVPSLALPPLSFETASQPNPPGGKAHPADPFDRYEAVQLLVQRVKAVRPAFALTPANIPAIADICQRLDGIPLALELAAARFQLLSAEQIATRLDQTFQLLGTGDRLARPRQQTLRATLDWSYNLLSEKEALLLRRLAVFVGDWTLEAAEQICSGRGETGQELAFSEILDCLARLVNKSLVVVEDPDKGARYRLLEIVRQYTLEKLAATGEEKWLRDRSLNYYLRLVGSIVRPVFGPNLVPWLHEIEKAYPNLRAAFEWSIEQEAWEKTLLLSAGLWNYWDRRDRTGEGCEWLEIALARTTHLGQTDSRAQALFAYGSLAAVHADFTLALDPLEECLATWQRLGNSQGVGMALTMLGLIALGQHQFETGQTRLAESLAILRRSGDHLNAAIAEGLLGIAYFIQEQPEPARVLLEQNLETARELNDPWLIARALTHLEELVRSQGDISQAEQLSKEALYYFELLDNPNMCAMTYCNLAQITQVQGKIAEALPLEVKGLRLLVLHQGGHEFTAASLSGLGGILLSYGQPVLAARIFGACERFQEKQGVHLQLNEQRIYETDLQNLKAQLDPSSLDPAWVEGRKLSPNQAITQVEEFQATLLNEAAQSGANSETSPAAINGGLTSREVEVLGLLAQGFTNKQIAQALVISPKTVNRHLETIFGKIGVNSRSAATRFAIERNLV